MDVSIIIVNYNTKVLLSECINSVFEKTSQLVYEIIVVDNASADDPTEFMQHEFPQVKFVRNAENIGFGRANNLGAMHAKGEFLFFLNTDTLLINNAIKELFEFMKRKDNLGVGACGANLFMKNTRPNFSYSKSFPSLSSMFLYRSQLLSRLGFLDYFNHTGSSKNVSVIIGADLFIRKNLFDSLGGFDPMFFMYVEDTELCFRINRAGQKISSVPAAKIIHYQGRSSTRASKLIMEVSSYMYFFKKHYNRCYLGCYKVLELFFATLKYVLFAVAFENKRKKEYGVLIRFLIKKIC